MVDIVRAVPLFQPALMHYADPVGQGEGFFLIVGDQQGGDIFLAENIAQFTGQGPAQVQIQAGKRFVQQKQGRAGGQCPCQRHPLLLATGQLMGVTVFHAGQPDPVQALADSLALLRARLFAQAERHIVGHGQVGKKGMFLEHHAQAPLFRRQLTAAAGDLPALDVDTATRDRFQPGNGAQGGGFATAAGPEQAGNFAGGQLQAQILYHGLLVVTAGQVFKGKQRRVHCVCAFWRCWRLARGESRKIFALRARLQRFTGLYQCWPVSRNSSSAFWACRRFSASSQTTERGSSIISWLTSSPRWAGRQCMKRASGSARSINSGVTW